jgi:hypothetical protein
MFSSLRESHINFYSSLIFVFAKRDHLKHAETNTFMVAVKYSLFLWTMVIINTCNKRGDNFDEIIVWLVL